MMAMLHAYIHRSTYPIVMKLAEDILKHKLLRVSESGSGSCTFLLVHTMHVVHGDLLFMLMIDLIIIFYYSRLLIIPVCQPG